MADVISKERRIALIVGWSLVTGLAIAGFWGIWTLVTGKPVPVVTEIMITQDYALTLPFGISRWWDALLGPVYSIGLIAVFTSKRGREDGDLAVGLIAGLTYGLAIGLNAGLAYGLGAGLVAGLVFRLVAGLPVGLVFGLGFGLGIGLGSGLAAGLAFGLAAGLAVILKHVVSVALWSAIGCWLAAKDKMAE